jgi:hypothetical protein
VEDHRSRQFIPRGVKKIPAAGVSEFATWILVSPWLVSSSGDACFSAKRNCEAPERD